MDERTYPARRGAFDDVPPELAGVAARYAAQPVPKPTAEESARLVGLLLVAEPAAAPGGAGWIWRPRVALRVARWRLRLLGPAFWCAGVILLALAGALTPDAVRHAGALPLVLMGPLTAVLGLAYALRTGSRGLREVEVSAPVSVAEVSAGLALALVVFDGALCAVLSAGLALLRVASFAGLLAAWLGPLLLLTGISLPIALRWGAMPAFAVGGCPWLLLALVAVVMPGAPTAALFALPTDALSIWLHAAAAACGTLLLLFVLLSSEWLSMLGTTRSGCSGEAVRQARG